MQTVKPNNCRQHAMSIMSRFTPGLACTHLISGVLLMYNVLPAGDLQQAIFQALLHVLQVLQNPLIFKYGLQLLQKMSQYIRFLQTLFACFKILFILSWHFLCSINFYWDYTYFTILMLCCILFHSSTLARLWELMFTDLWMKDNN